MKSKEVTKHKIVFLPEVEFDVIRSLIPKDNIEEYDALEVNKVKHFKLKDSFVLFVRDDYRTLLHNKAKKGEQL